MNEFIVPFEVLALFVSYKEVVSVVFILLILLEGSANKKIIFQMHTSLVDYHVEPRGQSPIDTKRDMSQLNYNIHVPPFHF